VQLECVRKYPDKIKDQLDIFDREICAYFAVDRNKPQVKKVIFQDYISNNIALYLYHLYQFWSDFNRNTSVHILYIQFL
jgi:hypothetical protein